VWKGLAVNMSTSKYKIEVVRCHDKTGYVNSPMKSHIIDTVSGTGFPRTSGYEAGITNARGQYLGATFDYA